MFNGQFKSILLFKGGTSLSKCFNLINRFSEDIDLVLDKNHFGIVDNPSKSQIKKLKKKACEFTSTELLAAIKAQLIEMGVPEDLFDITAENIEPTFPDKDPQRLTLIYKSVFDEQEIYISKGVIIEASSLSLQDPNMKRSINSMVCQHFPNTEFYEEPFEIPTIHPKRTLLEKVFLLHEEFKKQNDKIRSARMSRHLYDLNKLMNTDFLNEALNSPDLYLQIIQHRSLYHSLIGIDYQTHYPATIDFLPPEGEIRKKYKNDYEEMSQEMIYGDDKLGFDEIMTSMENLLKQIRTINLN
nr:nucleotidyl transferase AbiEii/AbiGii toxin family protein [Solitalea lacus]